MNILIVYAHPNPKSFCHAIKEEIINTAQLKGHVVKVRDLYALNFNPVLSSQDILNIKQGIIPLDIAQEQEAISWSNLMVIINPIWWTASPVILKGYYDRVFCLGFAYGQTPTGVKGLLGDKKVYIFNTLGNSHESYQKAGLFKSIAHTSAVGSFEFAGMMVIGHQFFASVPSVTQEKRQEMLKEVSQITANFN